MGRPKKISKLTETKYFQNVTPLWVQPNEAPIPNRYRDAIDSLVDWAGADWLDNSATNFFLIRQLLIKSCENWDAYDWQADADWINERKADAKHLESLRRAFAEFNGALSKAPFRHNRRMLGSAFLAELCPNAEIQLTISEGNDAVERALKRFERSLSFRDRAFARFGAVEYAGLPKNALPRKEVAIAVSLADQITYFRRDGRSEGTRVCPHKAHISKNLPWKAIALFASANCLEAENELTTTNVQTLVTSLARKVVLVHWSGDTPQNGESKATKKSTA